MVPEIIICTENASKAYGQRFGWCAAVHPNFALEFSINHTTILNARVSQIILTLFWIVMVVDDSIDFARLLWSAARRSLLDNPHRQVLFTENTREKKKTIDRIKMTAGTANHSTTVHGMNVKSSHNILHVTNGLMRERLDATEGPQYCVTVRRSTHNFVCNLVRFSWALDEVGFTKMKNGNTIRL